MGFRPPPAQSGSAPSNFVDVTDDYTASDGDFVRCDATAAGFTVTLPSTGSVIVKKVDDGGNAVAIAAAGGGTINGDAGGASITSPQFGAWLMSSAANTFEIVAPTSSSGSNGLGVTGQVTDGAGGYQDGPVVLYVGPDEPPAPPEGSTGVWIEQAAP